MSRRINERRKRGAYRMRGVRGKEEAKSKERENTIEQRRKDKIRGVDHIEKERWRDKNEGVERERERQTEIERQKE